MPKPDKTAPCGIGEARVRLRTARAYLDVAESVLGEQSRDEFLSVSAGLADLAGIAAGDAICCARLRCRHRGDTTGAPRTYSRPPCPMAPSSP